MCSPGKHSRATPFSYLYYKIKLFADDTSIYITVENALFSGDLLNYDLVIINTWSKNGLFLLTRQKLNVSPFL